MSTRDDLRDVAERVDGYGDWFAIQPNIGPRTEDWMVDSGARFICTTQDDGTVGEALAEFIAAASPDRVLALLARVADLEAGIRRLSEYGGDRGNWPLLVEALRALVGDETPETHTDQEA